MVLAGLLFGLVDGLECHAPALAFACSRVGQRELEHACRHTLGAVDVRRINPHLGQVHSGADNALGGQLKRRLDVVGDGLSTRTHKRRQRLYRVGGGAGQVGLQRFGW